MKGEEPLDPSPSREALPELPLEIPTKDEGDSPIL
jgi:hypothetical protein